MTDVPADHGSDLIGALRHLTGVSRQRTSWLSLDQHDVFLRDDGDLRLSNEKRPKRPGRHIATIARTPAGFELTAEGEGSLWVNREQVRKATLRQGDIVEFGDNGPMSRFDVIDDAHQLRRTIPEIFADAVDYLRLSRRPLGERTARVLRTVPTQCVNETTIFFRLFVIIALVSVAFFAYRQDAAIDRLRGTVAQGELQRERIAASLDKETDPAITREDLQALRAELVNALDARGDVTSTVVATAAPSIVFIQGGWGFRDKKTGRMLRTVVDEDGKPVRTRFGKPELSLDGEGPLVERQYTGTGFLAKGRGQVVTNRHVALPWEDDAAAIAGDDSPLEPVMIRFLGYFSGASQAVDLQLVAASDEADLAVLSTSGEWPEVSGLALAQAAPALGADLVAMGYPTGLRSLLARAGAGFLNRLRSEGDLGFWGIGDRLAAAGGITPLASRGIVAQATANALLFDADTTHGGSGGPVLDLSGRVIGIQSAIIPDFGGSNIAVPSAKMRAFFDEIDETGS